MSGYKPRKGEPSPAWHDEARRMRDEGMSLTAIAAVVGRSQWTVSDVLNPEQRRVRAERFRARNPDYATRVKREWREDPENAERARQSSREWKARNKERLRASAAAYRDRKATGRCVCGQRIYDGGDKCGNCKQSIAAEARREQIAARWAAGETLKQIADALNTSAAAVGVEMHRMRRDGWNLPFRRARQQVVA